MAAMVTATVSFGIAPSGGHDNYVSGNVDAAGLILTLVGFGILTLGGWLGGAVVYVHGMRVLDLVEEPAGRAVAPAAHPEREEAAS